LGLTLLSSSAVAVYFIEEVEQRVEGCWVAGLNKERHLVCEVP
jgi:hypothetical protein